MGKKWRRRSVAAAMLVLLLGGCTGAEVKDGIAGSLRSWCRQAENCTVHDDGPGNY